ncbi:hypothetical protein L1987_25080 [Smallanthus sonchifolius]|uniref:Uncharacterized protein n=1 Tax=Smallanthus sonchifolius TaxID=185202 RepID=A0ACB9INN3_9ASTR|nr:hypothetical protein L1987_25080 [Smallanthus sonchifolius]
MKKRKKKFPLLIVLVVLIGFTLFIVLWFVYAWSKKKTNGQQSQSSTNEPFSNVSYSQLLEATNGFSEANLIGKGGFSSVYKGILDNYGGFVAVKVIHLQIRGADRSFAAETDSNKNNSLAVKGTIGYAAPEYGLGSEMTSNGDVYSFGILLLKVMTGKRPTDDIFNDGLNLHNFAYMALQDGRVTEIIDDDILNYHQDDEIPMKSKTPNTMIIEECMSSFLKIGVLCSLDSPSQRMNIKNVVHELQRTKDTLQSV